MRKPRRDNYAVYVKGKVGRRYLWARFVLGIDARLFADKVLRENPTWTIEVFDQTYKTLVYIPITPARKVNLNCTL